MDVLEAMQQRRSIQSYKDIPLNQTQIFDLINAASTAPSAGNLQDWKIVIVTKEKVRQEIAKACHEQSWMAQAPVHLVICADTLRAKQFYQERGERLFCIQSCAAATQNILLAATHMGFGSSWVGAFDEKQLRDVVGIPGPVRPQAVITIGYANEIRPVPQKQPYKSFVYLERYGVDMSQDQMDKLGFEYNKLFTRKIKDNTKEAKSILDVIKQRLFK